MVLEWYNYALIFAAVFAAGFIDSIAGGGGLISIPAYMAAGLPPHFVLGNNKFSSTFGTLFAAAKFFRERVIDLPVATISAAFALAGSWLGTRTVLLLDPSFLRYVLMGLLPVIAALTFVKKDLGAKNASHAVSKERKFVLAAAAGLVIGFYDGFFGPGTGTFLILVYALAMKYDLVTANANTKVVNLASNVAALATFMAAGKIDYMIGIPAALCGIAGNTLGARAALKKGARLIRPIFITIIAALFTKIVWDVVTVMPRS